MMLDSLNDAAENIEYQIFVLDIISLIIQNSKSIGSLDGNHIKIIQELFTFRGGHDLKKSFLRFSLKDDVPLVVFKIEGK